MRSWSSVSAWGRWRRLFSVEFGLEERRCLRNPNLQQEACLANDELSAEWTNALIAHRVRFWHPHHELINRNVDIYVAYFQLLVYVFILFYVAICFSQIALEKLYVLVYSIMFSI